MVIEYKYQVFFKKKNTSKAITTFEPFTFYEPIGKGEKVVLASHLKKMKNMPNWVLRQNAWIVEDVVHTAEKSGRLVKCGAMLILIPSGLPDPGYSI